MAKILLVEDDANTTDLVVRYLRSQRHTVEAVDNAESALELLGVYPYDVLIVDWSLSGPLSGIDLCLRYRSSNGTARILLLTGKGEIHEKETGFDSGADDYLTKPFHMRELAVRVRALTRRPSDLVQDILSAGVVTLDVKQFLATKDGKDLGLTPREYSLLEFMMRHPNEVFSADALLDRVWQSDTEASTDTIKVCVTRLRKKLGEGDRLPAIKSIYGVGYKLELPQDS